MAQPADHEVAQPELRNSTGRRTFVPREEVLAGVAAAPTLDADRLRSDLDAVADQDPLSHTGSSR